MEGDAGTRSLLEMAGSWPDSTVFVHNQVLIKEQAGLGGRRIYEA